MGKYKNLLIRSLSGIVFVALIITSILYFSPYYFGVVFLLFTCLGLYEFYKLIQKPQEIEVSNFAGIIGGGILFICSFLHSSIESMPTIIFSAYGFFLVLCFLLELFRKKANPVNNIAYLLLGQIYIALPFSLLNYILFIQSYQPWLLLVLFITIWMNDTGAYLVGMLLGKHKLFERVSPKKTWEGFIGGAIFALAVGYIFHLNIPDIELWKWLFLAILVVIFGTLGDLCESLLKRTLNVKDSGNLIPGHGGILDRFDSLLMATPIILIYLSLIIQYTI